MIVTVSSKYRITIPKKIRQAIGLRAGQKLGWLKYGNHISAVPVPDPKTMRGFLTGAVLNDYRDKTDQF